jgi:ribosome-associated protein
MTFTVPEEELEIRASRSGGPGGQHVNTSATRVEVRWNVLASVALSTTQRMRLLEQLGHRIDAHGRLRVVASRRRSQLQNRAAAIERLTAIVAEALKPRKARKKTKPSKAARERRLAAKRRRAEAKRQRRRVDPDD